MGTCAPTQHPTKRLSSSTLIIKNEATWQRIRDAVLDDGNFYFVQEFQDIYTELYGAYLVPQRVAIFVLEFKRFMYLVLKFHTSQLSMQCTREDIQLMHYPPPRLIASPMIDRMWRLLCSNTKLYRKFCLNSFGALLDRDVLQSPPIEYYQATLKAYEMQFGTPNPSIWPTITNSFGLSSAYNGFVFMPASKFIEFHEYFAKRFPSGKIEEPELEYAKQMIHLREERLVELIQKKSNGHASIQREVSVNATPESAQPPVKLSKNKVLLQNQQGEEEVEIEDLSLHDDEQQDNAEKVSLQGNKEPTQDEKKETEGGTEDQATILRKSLKQNWKDLKFKIFDKLEKNKIEDDIIGYFRMEHTFSPELTDAIIKDYKRFLLLVFLGENQRSFMPSLWVKIVWENHTIQTICYRRFCYDVFGCFIHSQHFPRQVNLDQRQKYTNTILAYKEVFGEYPSSQIWPDPQIRFDYDEFYSSKYFNIYGYMYQVVNKVEKKQVEQELDENEVSREKQEELERKASIRSMKVARSPTRGREFISINANGNKPK